jgi:hypothetical protein
MNWKGDFMFRKSMTFMFVLMAMTLFLTPAWGSIPDATNFEDQALTFFRNNETVGTCVWVEFLESQPFLARGGGSGSGSGGGSGGGYGGGYGNNGSHRMSSQGTNASQQNQHEHQYQQRKTNKEQNQTQHQYQQQQKTEKQNQHQYQYQYREKSGAQN